MQVSSLTISESLNSKLLEYPDLVNRLQRKDYEFLELLQNWMKEVETILKNNRISECAVVAGYRSKIVAQSFGESQKRSTKKRQMQQASEIMFELQDTILNVIKPHENRVGEAREIVKQLLSVVKQSGALKYSDETNFQEFVNGIWHLCINHDQLKHGSTKILSLISQVDALRLIAEEINLVEWR